VQFDAAAFAGEHQVQIRLSEAIIGNESPVPIDPIVVDVQ
jgi:hypothetical protein